MPSYSVDTYPIVDLSFNMPSFDTLKVNVDETMDLVNNVYLLLMIWFVIFIILFVVLVMSLTSEYRVPVWAVMFSTGFIAYSIYFIFKNISG